MIGGVVQTAGDFAPPSTLGRGCYPARHSSQPGISKSSASTSTSRRGRRSTLPAEQREQTRRLKKQNMERRRRACISDKMTALHNLAMDIIGVDPLCHQRLEKADILAMCYHVFEGIAEIAREKPDLRSRLHRLRTQLLDNQQTDKDNFRVPGITEHQTDSLQPPVNISQRSAVPKECDILKEEVDKENLGLPGAQQVPASRQCLIPLTSPHISSWLSPRSGSFSFWPSSPKVPWHSTPSWESKSGYLTTNKEVESAGSRACFEDSGIVCSDTSNLHSQSVERLYHGPSCPVPHTSHVDLRTHVSPGNSAVRTAFKPVQKTNISSERQVISRQQCSPSECHRQETRPLSPPRFLIPNSTVPSVVKSQRASGAGLSPFSQTPTLPQFPTSTGGSAPSESQGRSSFVWRPYLD